MEGLKCLFDEKYVGGSKAMRVYLVGPWEKAREPRCLRWGSLLRCAVRSAVFILGASYL